MAFNALRQDLKGCHCGLMPRQNPQGEADRLEAATDQAIGACGGDVRAALKAAIVANEFLESEGCELMQAVSRAYVCGRFKTYTG